MKILIDNGHGIDTKGKRSPDSRLLEYAQNRLLARGIVDGLTALEKDFYLLRHTSCPAVLTENLFMDNHADCDFLLSKEGQQSLVDLHVDGICDYISQISI